MVLIGKITETGITCLLFKIREARDQNNIFMMCPLHALDTDAHKIKVQVVGDPNNQISGTIYVTAVLFPIQHIFLDCALGVIQNPEVINTNNNLRELSYITIDPNIYNGIVNKKAQIYFANKTGIVNSIDTKIKDMNYELGSSENISIIKRLPTPGGFILTEEDAMEGMSGSILVVDKSTVGMIVASSGIDYSKKSFSVAVDMYYLLPHIVQCVNSIDNYTNNNPLNLVNLCRYTTMKTFVDKLKPVVLHLGADYIFNQITVFNPEKNISLLNIHNYLEVGSLSLLQENLSNSISLKTALNTNEQFLDYFFNKQESSSVIFKSANYYDKVLNTRVDIDFVSNPLYANILDWSFRGDPFQPLILNLQTRTVNNDGSITLSEVVPMTFNSLPTTDTVFNQSYSRTTLQIPGIFFNKNNSIMTLINSYGITDIMGNSIRIRFLIWGSIGNAFKSAGNAIYNNVIQPAASVFTDKIGKPLAAAVYPAADKISGGNLSNLNKQLADRFKQLTDTVDKIIKQKIKNYMDDLVSKNISNLNNLAQGMGMDTNLTPENIKSNWKQLPPFAQDLALNEFKKTEYGEYGGLLSKYLNGELD